MAILIVDDSLAQQLALAALLEEEGYTDLLLAGSAAEAIDCLAEQSPETIDLILTDLYMPNVNGIEVCRQIKAMPAWRDIPIIVVTSSNEVDDLKLAFAAGAMDYITKPPHEVELLVRVRSALHLKREMEQRKAREQELHALNIKLERAFAHLAEQHQLLQLEQEKSEQLLLNVLPAPIAERLKQSPGVIADHFDEVTVLFADIVGFTALSATMDPESVVTMLNEVFSLFDQLAEQHRLEKIKTIGDAYMVVGGLPMPRSDHAQAVVAMALDMCQSVRSLLHSTLSVRIGIHSGPVVAGVIGRKKFIYDLWGDTVNIASRMESHGFTDKIQITEATYRLIQHDFCCEARGSIPIKGRGEMSVWYVLGRQNQNAT